MHLDLDDQMDRIRRVRIWLARTFLLSAISYLFSTVLSYSLGHSILEHERESALLFAIAFISYFIFRTLRKDVGYLKSQTADRKVFNHSLVISFKSRKLHPPQSFKQNRVIYFLLLGILTGSLLVGIIYLLVAKLRTNPAILIATASLLTSATSLAGIILATILALRKEPREQQQSAFMAMHSDILKAQSDLDLKKKALEIEKLRRELAQVSGTPSAHLPVTSAASKESGLKRGKGRHTNRSRTAR